MNKLYLSVITFFLLLFVFTRAEAGTFPALSIDSSLETSSEIIDIFQNILSEKLQFGSNIVLNESNNGIDPENDNIVIDFHNTGFIAEGTSPCFVVAIPAGALELSKSSTPTTAVYTNPVSDPKAIGITLSTVDSEGNVLSDFTKQITSLDIILVVEGDNVKVDWEADAISGGDFPSLVSIGSANGLKVEIGDDTAEASTNTQELKLSN